MQKLKKNEARPIFTGSYFKKACVTQQCILKLDPSLLNADFCNFAIVLMIFCFVKRFLNKHLRVAYIFLFLLMTTIRCTVNNFGSYH